jgi:hypothetical protein
MRMPARGYLRIAGTTLSLALAGAIAGVIYALLCELAALPIQLICGSCRFGWLAANAGPFAFAGGASGAITGAFGELCGRRWEQS